MFWYIVGFFAIIVSLLALWVNASAFGMQEDGTPQSEYEKNVGSGREAERQRYGCQGTRSGALSS